LRNLHAHGFRNGSVIVRSFRKSQNIQNGKTKGSSTDVSRSTGGGIGVVHGFHFRKQRFVESSLRTVQPLDSHMHRAPFGFDSLAFVLLDRVEVQRAAVPEVEARPQEPIHGGGV
jgi:hypothetical protein